jgi:ATP-dependent DNA helicase RecG
MFAGKEIAQQIAKSVGENIKELPFALTKSQERVLANLLVAISSGKKLDSFVYGDVGSGKTVVVLLLAKAYMSLGYSVILATPTSILANQHVETVRRLFNETFFTSVSLITGKSTKGKLDATLPRLFIGTHALLWRDFLCSEKIALTIIDEQHRFGVDQREQLTTYKDRHAVTLSATPIPRTLALSFLGFSAAEEITEKPIGRKEVITKVVPLGKEADTYNWIAKRIEKGERIYLVFPRVEDDESSEKQSLLAMADVLKDTYFKKYKTATLYGGMKEQEKLDVMEDFAKGKTDLLFATSVIEVGIDVPEATTILIHGAEYFGLAQLHQLRGRVGRSEKQSYCFLLSQAKNEKQLERLQFFSEHTDGLSVSEYDLKNRGSGTILGTVQSGESELKIASLQDLYLIKEAMEIYSNLKAQHVKIPAYIL